MQQHQRRTARAATHPRARRGAAPIAALDLGTNNCRLLVAEPAGTDFRVVDSFSRAVRLGEGVEGTGRLSDAAMTRTLAALAACAGKVRRRGAERFVAVATEACRRAVNGREFIARARAESAVDLVLITPEEEARLAVAGCAPLVDPEADQLLVFDIGGGSTEIVWLDLTGVVGSERRAAVQAVGFGGADGVVPAAILDWISVPMGVATLHDKFVEIEDPRRRFALMSWYFEEHLSDFAPDRGGVGDGKLQLIGVSGSVTTIASAHLGLRRYDRSRIDGLWMPAAAAMRIAEQLASLSDAARARHPSVGADRARLIVAGGAIICAIIGLWPASRLRIADRGLREGLLYSLMGRLE